MVFSFILNIRQNIRDLLFQLPTSIEIKDKDGYAEAERQRKKIKK